MKSVIKSQYLAALEMLRHSVEACPEPMWDDPAFKNRFWRIAYHTLFYTDFYLSRTEPEFHPWERHIHEAVFLGIIPWEPERGEAPACPTISQQDVRDYLDYIAKKVGLRVDETDLDAASGFPWLLFNKLELQFYNIRHIQHHAGQLIKRIRQGTGKGIDWVGTKKEG